jgi:transposase
MFLKHGVAVGWKLPNIRFAGSNTACFNCAGRIIHERIEIRERICPILVATRRQNDGPGFQHTFRPQEPANDENPEPKGEGIAGWEVSLALRLLDPAGEHWPLGKVEILTTVVRAPSR